MVPVRVAFSAHDEGGGVAPLPVTFLTRDKGGPGSGDFSIRGAGDLSLTQRL